MSRPTPPFRADHVGSLLRPEAIKAARKQVVQDLEALDLVEKIEQRQIELGARLQDGIVVEKGLEPGERVVVDGLQKVRPGMAVQVL